MLSNPSSSGEIPLNSHQMESDSPEREANEDLKESTSRSEEEEENNLTAIHEAPNTSDDTTSKEDDDSWKKLQLRDKVTPSFRKA
jgi:hypothetical protein